MNKPSIVDCCRELNECILGVTVCGYSGRTYWQKWLLDDAIPYLRESRRYLEEYRIVMSVMDETRDIIRKYKENGLTEQAEGMEHLLDRLDRCLRLDMIEGGSNE